MDGPGVEVVEEDAPEQDGEELGEGADREHRAGAGRGGKATRDYWVRRGRWWMEWELGKVDEVGGDEPTKGG